MSRVPTSKMHFLLLQWPPYGFLLTCMADGKTINMQRQNGPSFWAILLVYLQLLLESQLQPTGNNKSYSFYSELISVLSVGNGF